MPPEPQQNTNLTEPPTPDPVEASISHNRTLYYPSDMDRYLNEKLSILNRLNQVPDSILAEVREVSRVVAIPLLLFGGEQAAKTVLRQLARINPLVVTASTEPILSDLKTYKGKRRIVFGATDPIGGDRYTIAIARTHEGRFLTKYELAGTLFHELTHAADFFCERIDIDSYKPVYAKYQRLGLLDPQMKKAVNRDENEYVARAFQFTFFGLHEPSLDDAEFVGKAIACRDQLPDLVELVEQEFNKIYDERRYLQMTSTTSRVKDQITFRPIKEGRRIVKICEYGPATYCLDPLVRGTYQWLREQALQAEKDPNREWDGFLAEWDQLLAGTHPDPHPELIIYGHPMNNFDPRVLEDPSADLRIWDLRAYDHAMSNNPQITRSDLPPKSQQLFAAMCRRQVDVELKYDTGSSLVLDE